MEKTLSARQRRIITAIIGARLQIAVGQDAVTEDCRATALKLGVKASDLDALIGPVVKGQRVSVLPTKAEFMELAKKVIALDLN